MEGKRGGRNEKTWGMGGKKGEKIEGETRGPVWQDSLYLHHCHRRFASSEEGQKRLSGLGGENGEKGECKRTHMF